MKRLAIVLLVATGCVQSAAVPCGDVLCPADKTCVAGVCTDQACQSKVEGEACEGSIGAGVCTAGACVAAACGNGFVDGGEACDDGNRQAGDGCRSDCQKIEVCGDAEKDDGEACDDGNQNAVDGCHLCQRQDWISAAAVGSRRLATEFALTAPTDVQLDLAGNLYIADYNAARVFKVTADGTISTVAGNGERGTTGDGQRAGTATISAPYALAVDGLGAIFIADTTSVVRKVSANGLISKVAGVGHPQNDYNGDDRPAISANIYYPHGVAVSRQGDVFIADTFNHRVRKVDSRGIISTVAGNGIDAETGDGGPATAAAVLYPHGVAVAADGTIYIGGYGAVRKVAPDGIITSLPMEALGLALDRQGNLYGVMPPAHRAYRYAVDGSLTTIAGSEKGFAGDGGLATAALLSSPSGIAVNADGEVFIADTGNTRIRKIGLDGMIQTVAGRSAGLIAGDGGPATQVRLDAETFVHLDGQDNLLISDNLRSRIARVTPNGTITTFAGSGVTGFAGDAGPATAAQLSDRLGDLARDASGQIYFADMGNHRIRKVDTNGTISTVAGNGTAGSSGDGGAALAAAVNPSGSIVALANGDIVFAERARIRRIATNGTISTIGGDGTAGFTGDGGAATAARFSAILRLARLGANDLIVVDSENARIRRIVSGEVTTIAGTGAQGNTGDGGLATAAQIEAAGSVMVDTDGSVLFTQFATGSIRRIRTDGIIEIAINCCGAGDGGTHAQARLHHPTDMVRDAAGSLYITQAVGLVRKLAADGSVATIAGFVGPEGLGPIATARLAAPVALTTAGDDTLVATASVGVVERVGGGVVAKIAGRHPLWVGTDDLAYYRDNIFEAQGVAWDEQLGELYISNQETIVVVRSRGAGIDPAVPQTWRMAIENYDLPGFRDGVLGMDAQFRAPTGLFIDAGSRTLYIADTGNHAIRALNLDTKAVTTVVNTANRLGFAGDDGPASAALLFQPRALTRCDNGDFFIADTGNQRIRRVALGLAAPANGAVVVSAAQVAAGTMSTVLGDGVATSSGDGQPATIFPVDHPLGVACDAAGNLFVSSTRTLRALPADASGHVDGQGPVLTIYGNVTNRFPEAETQCISGLLVREPAGRDGPSAGHATRLTFADGCSGLMIDLSRAAAP